jgi:L-malate glycosyltransferase
MSVGNRAGVISRLAIAPAGVSVAEKISVCYVASADLWAGAEVQVSNVLHALARKERLQVSAILLNEGRLADELRGCGIEVKIIPENRLDFLQILTEGATYLRDRKVHVLHSHRYKENLLAACLGWRCRIPFVVRTQHGGPEPFRGFGHWKQRLICRLDLALARYATDAVICVSDELHSQLARHINPKKIVTIHNGIDTSKVDSTLTMAEAKRRLAIPESCLVFGVAGRLEPIKRLDIFLASAKRITMQLPHTRFVIVGEGSRESELRELAREHKIDGRVLFLGHRRDIYDVLRAFDVFVLCSDHEGVPMALLEALCLGVPVVARRVGGVPEVIQDGVSGVLVESAKPDALAKACIQVLQDERQKCLALAGTSFVREKFDVGSTADQVLKLYFSLCGIT